MTAYSNPVLTAALSFQVIKGVASGLLTANPLQATNPFDASKQLFMITGASGIDVDGNVTAGKRYFFDAIFREDHERVLNITEHPVQDSANITDHSYMSPLRLMVEIGMSDVMKTFSDYINDGLAGLALSMAGLGESRSVNLYKSLCDLQDSRSPFTITSRLGVFPMMLIKSLMPRNDYTTINALRCEITFQQVIVGTVSYVQKAASSQAQSIVSTDGGEVTPEALTP